MCIVWTSVYQSDTDTRRPCSTFPIGTGGVSRAHPDMPGESNSTVEWSGPVWSGVEGDVIFGSWSIHEYRSTDFFNHFNFPLFLSVVPALPSFVPPLILHLHLLSYPVLSDQHQQPSRYRTEQKGRSRVDSVHTGECLTRHTMLPPVQY